MAVDLSLIFKAYDVRGVYPEQFDEDAARRIGRAFARWVESPRIVLGRDCRLSSPALAEAFVSGVTAEGAGVVDIGLATTDMVYFASGRLSLPGAMFTASHNPPQYNGLKLCRPGAAPVGEETGLRDVRDLAARLNGASAVAATGTVEHRDLTRGLSRAPPVVRGPRTPSHRSRSRPTRRTAWPASWCRSLFERLPCDLVPLYMDLDGTFPNHPADPIQPENQRTCGRPCSSIGADLGLAFDGDADRVFLVDERRPGRQRLAGDGPGGRGMLERFPGSKIVYNLICSWAVPEVIREHGGVPVRTRVGHSFIKQVMAETGAVFGGEHSGHYYFRDHYSADSGLVASMVVMDQLSKAGRPLSELLAPLRRYADSGEINSEVRTRRGDRGGRGGFRDGRQDRLDGLTVEYDDWWFNVRASNTEPLLRLNVEARTRGAARREDRARSWRSSGTGATGLTRGGHDAGRQGAAGDPGVSELPRGASSCGTEGDGELIVCLHADCGTPCATTSRSCSIEEADATVTGGGARDPSGVLDDPGRLRALDPGGTLGQVAGLGRQLRRGYRTAAGPTGLPSGDGVRAVVVCGMGGSGVAGDVLRGLYADRVPIPIVVDKAYALPEFAGPHTLVTALSFSGNTEETLAAYGEAIARGCRVVAVSAGGELAERAGADGVTHVPLPTDVPMPRMAVGDLSASLIGALEAMGLVPAAHEEVEEAASLVDDLAGRLGPDRPLADNVSKELAAWIGERTPVVWGSEGLAEAPAATVPDPGQRERKGAGVLRGALRAGPQRDRGMVRGFGARLRRHRPSARARASSGGRPPRGDAGGDLGRGARRAASCTPRGVLRSRSSSRW